jgi:Tfp pilus assembly protein PilF
MRREVIICFGLAAITLALFWPVSRYDFINLDDPDYVTQNPVVQDGLTGPGLHWAFGPSHANNWHPLTWLSHMLDCQLFGLKAGAHHLVSLCFQIASTVLVFLALHQMTRAVWRSALVAALFAWHPLHVESVAWVAERKDVLSAFFFMLTLWAYSGYVRAQGPKSKVQSQQPASSVAHNAALYAPHAPRSNLHARRFTLHASRFYVLSLLCFALGLMSKPMLVTLPFVLLLLDYWPLRRMQKEECRMQNTQGGETLHAPRSTLYALLAEKLPFLALALAVSLLTVRAQHAGGAIASLEQLPGGSRLANAPAAYWAYLGKTFWPANLCVFYPYVPVSAWKAVVSAVLLLGVTGLCLEQTRRRPYLLVGWCWFCLMLLPVIGLVQVGWQALADRYTYLPLIGVFVMLAWAAGELALRSRAWRFGVALCAVLLLGTCLAATRIQLSYWQNSIALFSHALQASKGNWLAHNNLGTALAEQGKLDEAAEHFRAALQINSAYEDARNNLGRFLAVRGKWYEAEAVLEEVVRRSPHHALAHRNLGHVLLCEGKTANGIAQYALARQLRPDDPATPEDLAATLTRQAPSPALLPHLRAALDLLPTAQMRAQVAASWAAQGKPLYAVQAYRAALALQPDSPEILNNLAWLLATSAEPDLRDGAEAVRLAERACDLTGSRRTLMVGTLAAAYAEAGRFPEAVATAQKACALAAESGEQSLVATNQQLLQFYRQGRPYPEQGLPAPAASARSPEAERNP